MQRSPRLGRRRRPLSQAMSNSLRPSLGPLRCGKNSDGSDALLTCNGLLQQMDTFFRSNSVQYDRPGSFITSSSIETTVVCSSTRFQACALNFSMLRLTLEEKMWSIEDQCQSWLSLLYRSMVQTVDHGPFLASVLGMSVPSLGRQARVSNACSAAEIYGPPAWMW